MVTFLLHTWREKDLSFMVVVCLPFHSVDVSIFPKNFHLFAFVHRAKDFYCHLLYQKHEYVSVVLNIVDVLLVAFDHYVKLF